jgi:hypothetical protein
MTASEKRHPPVVTIAALYGAAGSVIGPRIAEQLGVPLLDREVPEAVAKKTGIPEAAVADVDEEPRSGIDRLAARLGRASTMSGAVGGLVERLDLQQRDIPSRSVWPGRASRAAWRSGAAGWSSCALSRGRCTSTWADPPRPACNIGSRSTASTIHRRAAPGDQRPVADGVCPPRLRGAAHIKLQRGDLNRWFTFGAYAGAGMVRPAIVCEAVERGQAIVGSEVPTRELRNRGHAAGHPGGPRGRLHRGRGRDRRLRQRRPA